MADNKQNISRKNIGFFATILGLMMSSSRPMSLRGIDSGISGGINTQHRNIKANARLARKKRARHNEKIGRPRKIH